MPDNPDFNWIPLDLDLARQAAQLRQQDVLRPMPAPPRRNRGNIPEGMFMRPDRGRLIWLFLEINRHHPQPAPLPQGWGDDQFWHYILGMARGYLPNWEAELLKGQEQLPEIQIDEKPVCPRKITLPPFHLPYETAEEIQLRLLGTIILIKNSPFFVEHAIKKDKDYQIIVSDEDDNRTIVHYNKGNLDLRSPEPGYINTDVGAYYFIRPPTRQQRQGLVFNQIYLKTIGSEDAYVPHSKKNVMLGLKYREPCKWTGDAEQLLRKRIISNLRLNNSLAVYIDSKTIKAEYKGRYLGDVRDDRVSIEKRDNRPWIIEDLKSADLNPSIN